MLAGRVERPIGRTGVSPMNLAMAVVLCVILVSFVVGCLTSSVDTEQKLPHRF